jgi:hypothetical protein
VRGGTGRALLSCAAPLYYGLWYRCCECGRYRAGLMEADQNVIRRVLKTSVRLVKLTSSLGSQLAKLVPVFNMGKSPKDQIRTHIFILLLDRVTQPFIYVSGKGNFGSSDWHCTVCCLLPH